MLKHAAIIIQNIENMENIPLKISGVGGLPDSVLSLYYKIVIGLPATEKRQSALQNRDPQRPSQRKQYKIRAPTYLLQSLKNKVTNVSRAWATRPPDLVVKR